MFNFAAKIDKTIPIPLYYQLRSIILDQIKSGEIVVGECIPTEQEFREKYDVSRSTVRQAVSELVQDGWLERKTSKGTFVITRAKKTSQIRAFEPFHQQVARNGNTPRTELIELSVIEANNDISANLGISVNDKVILMFRRRFSNETPMVTIRNFLPFDVCNYILGHDFKKESLYEVLTQNTVSKAETTKTIISTEKASAEDVALLNIKPSSPILCFNTISKSASGRVIDYAFSRYHGDLNSFEIDIQPIK